MIIDIDAGNTALKWRLSDGRPARRVLLAELAQVAEALQGQPVTGVRVSCVAGESVKQRLSDWAAQHWGVVARFAQPEKNFAGLKVAYAQPVRLGVDRWLAMLAARQRCAGAVCVIDCGSAITVDRVAAAPMVIRPKA